MSSTNEVKKLNLDPSQLTFPDTVKNKMTDEQRKQIEEDKKIQAHNDEINKLKEEAEYLHLPNDPFYRPISMQLLEINDFNKTISVTTRIMINIALSDYAIIRKINDDNDTVENVKFYFKRIGVHELQEFNDVQQELDYYNNKILLLINIKDKTEETYDKIREYQVKVKDIINKKIDTGLKVFFKKHKEYDITADKGSFDYNDMLFAIEVAYYRYTQGPFLRQISQTNSSLISSNRKTENM